MVHRYPQPAPKTGGYTLTPRAELNAKLRSKLDSSRVLGEKSVLIDTRFYHAAAGSRASG